MRGELFWAEIVHADGTVKRRPVLEVSALELTSPLVVPVTSTAREIPSDVPLHAHGIKGVLNALALGTIRRENLTQSIGFVDRVTMEKICRAIAWTAGC